MDTKKGIRQGRTKRGRAVAFILIACMLVVMLWAGFAALHRRPFAPFSETAAVYAGFAPTSSVGQVRQIEMDPDEPGALNIMAAAITAAGQPRSIVRLTHGYNMPMCMRIKHYKVEAIEYISGKDPGYRLQVTGHITQVDTNSPPPLIQAWRLTSPTGAKAIWLTRILRSADLSDTGVDVCDLPFPRVGIPDAPDWNPKGIGWETLRNPWRWFRLTLRSAWNSARCDLAVFLRLKQPPWASDEVLTMVASSDFSKDISDEMALVCELALIQQSILKQARDFRANRSDAKY